MLKIPTLLLSLGLLTSAKVRAFNPQPDPPGYGMIGVSAGQTLRLNISNVELPPSSGFPPGPCRVELTFFDGAGIQLVPAVQTTLAPGVSTHLDLRGDDVTTRDLLRREVRPSVKLLDIRPAAGVGAFPPDPCVSSIEIIDNATGKTLLTAGPQNAGVTHGFNPQPEPPGVVGLVGIVAGQAARLNAVNVPVPGDSGFPPGPCRALLVFFNAEGAVLAHSSTVLNPGEATFLDVWIPDAVTGVAADIGSRPARVEVRGVVTVERVEGRGFPPGPCRLTLEILDRTNAKTISFLSQ